MTLDFQTTQSPTARFWNETLAPKFVRYRHILVGGLSQHTAAVFPSLDVPPNARVADIGCGFGDTAIELARRVGPAGHVTGIDVCEDFLAIAREEQLAAGVTNLRFLAADVEGDLPVNAYDFAFSRFGTMFFANPVVGLRNIARSLRPGGRITQIVWRAREDNPWLAAAHEVLLAYLPQPDANEPNCGPGPFSMADPETLEAQLTAAGFIDISFRQLDALVMVGKDVEEAIAFQLAIGPAGEIFRAAGHEAGQKRGAIEDDLRTLFRSQFRNRDGIWMRSSSWVVDARLNGI